MEIIIGITLGVISLLGFLTAIGLFIAFIANSRSDSDLYLDDYECDCYLCSRDIPPADVCSSECDDACAARDHCSSPDPWCSCNDCMNHRLDELPPKASDE